MAELIEKLIGCDHCDHEAVCSFKKENSQKQIAYPKVENFSSDFLQFDINVKCKYFSEAKLYYKQKECISKPEKPCKKCMYNNSMIPFDQSPCWGCTEENGYSNFKSYV